MTVGLVSLCPSFSYTQYLSFQVCIVFTDGKAHDSGSVPAAQKAWEKFGVTVFAVGIGKGISNPGVRHFS